MFPATPFIGYSMLPLAEPVFLAQPVFQPAQGFNGVPPMIYGAFPIVPAFYQQMAIPPVPILRPVQFLPQGNLGQFRPKNADLSVQSACMESVSPHGSSTMSSSPGSSQESSSGYSSDTDNGSSPVQYHYQEALPTGKRLPIFKAIHQKGLKQLQDRQKVFQNGQQVPCPEGKFKEPEEKKLPRRYKTVLCKHFMVGKCRNGNECRYAHGVEELRVPALPRNYKTRPCVNFMLKGHCPLGKKCDFIH